MKIQQMAFMLVALMIFFGMVALIYFAINLSNLESQVNRLQDQEAQELVRKLSGTPEFIFTSSTDCSSCIDMDKVERIADPITGLIDKYENLWNIDYLMVECIYTSKASGCSPEVEVIKKTDQLSTKTAFVTLAQWDDDIKSFRYDLGKIHASIREVE
jgi:hypothetical protein